MTPFSRSDARPDQFAAWLDADGPGKAPPDPRSDADPDLAAACEAARQVHDLDSGLQRYASAISSHRTRTWEDLMLAHTELQPAFPVATTPIPAPVPLSRHRRRSPWHAMVNALIAATLILGLSVGIWREAGSPSLTAWLDSSGDGPNAIIPAASPTADPARTSSSYPYPTSSECTITPLSREEVRAHYEAANGITAPSPVLYQQAIEPSNDDASAIMETFRMWQACGLSGRAMAYDLALVTPWFTASWSPWFIDNRPVPARTLDYLIELTLADESEHPAIAAKYPDVTSQRLPVYGPIGTPADATPAMVPVPADATPMTRAASQGRAFPSIFAKDIQVIGPDRARALAYFVYESTGEIAPTSPQSIDLVKVDGRWLIDSISGGGPVG